MVGSSSSFSSTSTFQQRCKSSIVDYSKYLPEDVWIDIFSRLPVNFIFKFRCVSKLWLSFLSKPCFITGICNSLTSPLWTLFYQLNYGVFADSCCQLFSNASPKVHFQFISHHDGFSFRFLQEEKIYLLASSNGLVLCSTSLEHQRKYYVCNPLTKKWVSLPLPTLSNPTRFFHDGFICDSSLVTFTSKYKVVRIPEFSYPATTFDLEIFSSDMGEWKTHKVSCPQTVTILHSFSRNVVSLNGNLYWMEGQNRIIAYNLNNNNKNSTGHECRLINLPKEIEDSSDLYNQCLGESEGLIRYCQVQRKQMTLSVWELEEDYSDGTWVWHLVHGNIELNHIFEAEITGRYKGIERIIGMVIRPLAFNPVDRNVVILNCHTSIFAYNVQTKKSQLLSQKSEHLFRMWVLAFVLIPKPTILPPCPIF